MKSKDRNSRSRPYDFLRFWSTTLSLILAVGFLGYLGHLLDDFLGIVFPVFTLVAIFAGLTGAVVILLRQLK